MRALHPRPAAPGLLPDMLRVRPHSPHGQVPREFPYDNLKAELGGDNGLESCVKYH